jgi:hypothetical protein
MKAYTRFAVPLILAAVASISPVSASVSGRKNSAIGASALALYELARGHAGTGLLAGAGAAYAWNQYDDAHGHRHFVGRPWHWHRR